MKNIELFKSLKKRGLSETSLASLAGIGRSHLSGVLCNVAGRGGRTRLKLFLLLTDQEVSLLGWLPEYQQWQKKRAGTLEQCFTGNNVPNDTAVAS